MKCKEIKQKIILQSEGILSNRESLELERHLSECPSCRIEAKTDEQLNGVLSSFAEVDPLPSGWDKLLEKIEARPLVRSYRTRYVFAFSAVSVIIILLILGSFMGLQHNKQHIASTLPTPQKKIAVKHSPLSIKEKVVEQKVAYSEEVKSPQTAKRTYAAPDSSVQKLVHSARIHAGRNVKKIARMEYPHHRRHRLPERPIAVAERKHIVRRDTLKHPVDSNALPQVAENVDVLPVGSTPAVHGVSSEMKDLIVEGMSALVEASEDFNRSDKETQL